MLFVSLLFHINTYMECCSDVEFSFFLKVCSNAARVYVENEIYDQFMERIVRKVNQIRIGDPLDPESQMGALISEEHLQKVLGFMDIAKKEVCLMEIYVFSC